MMFDEAHLSLDLASSWYGPLEALTADKLGQDAFREIYMAMITSIIDQDLRLSSEI